MPLRPQRGLELRQRVEVACRDSRRHLLRALQLYQRIVLSRGGTLEDLVRDSGTSGSDTRKPR